MKRLKLTLLTLGLLALNGCQTVDAVVGGPETRYGCVTGGSVSTRAGMGRHHLDVTYTQDGQTYYSGALDAVPSDFGERFRAADGTSFWINDDKGLFSRPGDSQMLCHREL